MPLDHSPQSDLRLAPDEIDPVLELNSNGASPFLFTSDHYGRVIPRMLGDLGLPESELTRHIAWDIGIAGVAERVSNALNGHLIAQRYSRLVIDCNRPPEAVSSIPLISEATTIPGNDGLTQEAKARRRELFFDPYHHRIDAVIDQRLKAGRPTVLVSLHSFTPVYAGIKRGISGHCISMTPRCRRCCCSTCAPKAIWWWVITSPMRCRTPPTTRSPCMAKNED
jgi:predicted N-formylglutamate amidohydrolase